MLQRNTHTKFRI